MPGAGGQGEQMKSMLLEDYVWQDRQKVDKYTANTVTGIYCDVLLKDEEESCVRRA